MALLNSAYDTISKMLHPDNPLRKIFQIQMIGVGQND